MKTEISCLFSIKKSPVLAIVLGLALCTSGFAAETRTSAKPTDSRKSATESKKAPPAPQTPPPTPRGTNLITQSAAKAGISTCIARADQVTNFILGNSKAGATLFTAPSNPNDHLFSTSLELQSGNVLSYASVSFSPGGAKGCGAIYDAVTYWQNNCNDVATKAFAQLKPAGALRGGIAILDGGPTMKIYLMPAGTGCIQIKKEVAY